MPSNEPPQEVMAPAPPDTPNIIGTSNVSIPWSDNLSEKKSITKVEETDVGNDSSDKDLEANFDDVRLDREVTVFKEDRGKLQQGLNQRHLQMIALVGVFGTGIFLGSGSVLYTAGPLGSLLCFIVIAFIVGLNQAAVAEVACLVPVSSATVRHLEQFVDPALSFAYGWILVWDCILPADISAAALIIDFWGWNVHQAIWISILIFCVSVVSFMPIRAYGEMEFCFALCKLALLIILIITSIYITSGSGGRENAIWFKYWTGENGPFQEFITNGSLGRFSAFWKGLSGVVYSFGGVQSVPTLAAEVQHPRRAIFRACKRIFYRVSILMILTIFFLSMIISSTHPSIAPETGSAQSSPFVIAMKEARIKALPHIVNTMILSSAFSSASAKVISGSRTLFALAVKGQAPQFFLRTNKRGIPYWGSLFVMIFTPLSFMSLSQSGAVVFSWFQDLIAANQLVGWILISWNHIAMNRAIKVQGYSRERLPHSISFAPCAAWVSGIGSVILILTSGFQNFVPGHFEISSFLTCYFIIPLTFGLYISWKLFKKTKYLKPDEIDLASLFEDVEQNPEPPYEKLRGWKLCTLLWS